MHSRFGTGSMPGMAASTRLTWLLGSAPNAVDAPENSLALDVTWAWTSMPITTSQGPVAPSMSLLMASAPPPDVGAGGETGRLLHHFRHIEQGFLVEFPADELQAHGQAAEIGRAHV